METKLKGYPDFGIAANDLKAAIITMIKDLKENKLRRMK